MSVYGYIYIYVYLYICIYIYIYVYLYLYIYMNIYNHNTHAHHITVNTELRSNDPNLLVASLSTFKNNLRPVTVVETCAGRRITCKAIKQQCPKNPDPSRIAFLRTKRPLLYRFIHSSIGGSLQILRVASIN